MVIFHSYVKLPEGKLHENWGQKSTSVFAMKTESLLRHAEKRARTMSSGLPAAPPFRILGEAKRPLNSAVLKDFNYVYPMVN